MKNDKFIAQSFVPKTETKIVLENQQKPKLSLAARTKIINMNGSNYQSPLIESNISEVKGYGPCKWNNPNCSCSVAELERQAAELKVQREREALEYERKQREQEEAKKREIEEKEAERKRKETERREAERKKAEKIQEEQNRIW